MMETYPSLIGGVSSLSSGRYQRAMLSASLLWDVHDEPPALEAVFSIWRSTESNPEELLEFCLTGPSIRDVVTLGPASLPPFNSPNYSKAVQGFVAEICTQIGEQTPGLLVAIRI